jgi:hypothetical protein
MRSLPPATAPRRAGKFDFLAYTVRSRCCRAAVRVFHADRSLQPRCIHRVHCRAG